MTTDFKDTLRRGLSGIYIFDTLPQDNGRRKPTCLEDCTEEKRLAWLDAQEIECLRKTAEHLDDVMDRIWAMMHPEEQAQIRGAYGCQPYCEFSPVKSDQIDIINRFCKIIRIMARIYKISADGSEAQEAEKENKTDKSNKK